MDSKLNQYKSEDLIAAMEVCLAQAKIKALTGGVAIITSIVMFGCMIAGYLPYTAELWIGGIIMILVSKYCEYRYEVTMSTFSRILTVYQKQQGE